MGIISNNIYELRESARLEIENFELKPGEKVITHFSEFPSIAGFPFGMVLIEKSDGTIYSSFRQWDTEYDLIRWNNGIYNLDRLRIITDKKNIIESDQENLKNWILKLEKTNLPQSIQNEKALVLDGSDWKFGICFENSNIDYKWKVSTDAIELFVPIIELMKNQHKTKNKRH